MPPEALQLPPLQRRPGAAVFAIVGAESTGKSTVAQALASQVSESTGLACVWVPEVLRAWCDQAGRTPRVDEQAGIAAEQARLIALAHLSHPVVICDTTPLMTAVYHRQVFGDRSLDAAAVQWQRGCTLSLLTALDLPWQADGLQRDGPQVRLPVDAALRELLVGHALPFTVVAGHGPRRVEAALDAISAELRHLAAPRPGLFSRLHSREAAQPAWQWHCDDCDSPECEHALRHARSASATSLQGG
jgi:nicotinamide riboside kinase